MKTAEVVVLYLNKTTLQLTLRAIFVYRMSLAVTLAVMYQDRQPDKRIVAKHTKCLFLARTYFVDIGRALILSIRNQINLKRIL